MGTFVAVTTSVDPEGGVHAKPQVALYTNYLTVLERIGLTCVLVTPAHAKESIARLLDGTCGLMLPGGEDVEPSRYGAEPHPELGAVNPGRDAMELRALDEALERGMPVLGLCRGHQLINVYFGGALYQDIAEEIPEEVSHYQTADWGEHHHEAVVESGTLLADVLSERMLRINSFHHQAIKRVAPGLRVSAVADDGLIEAVEHEELPWVLGVQWHPERHEAQAPASDPNRQLFRAFRDAAQAYDRRRDAGRGGAGPGRVGRRPAA